MVGFWQNYARASRIEAGVETRGWGATFEKKPFAATILPGKTGFLRQYWLTYNMLFILSGRVSWAGVKQGVWIPHDDDDNVV